MKLNTYIACIIVFLCAFTEGAYAQKLKWNFGLPRKQSSEVIPHSKHSFQTAKPKEKTGGMGEKGRDPSGSSASLYESTDPGGSKIRRNV